MLQNVNEVKNHYSNFCNDNFHENKIVFSSAYNDIPSKKTGLNFTRKKAKCFFKQKKISFFSLKSEICDFFSERSCCPMHDRSLNPLKISNPVNLKSTSPPPLLTTCVCVCVCVVCLRVCVWVWVLCVCVCFVREREMALKLQPYPTKMFVEKLFRLFVQELILPNFLSL